MLEQTRTIHIYLGALPERSDARRALRDRGLALQQLLGNAAMPDAIDAILNARLDSGEQKVIDLVVLAPEAILVGALIDCPDPVDILPDGRWMLRNGQEVRGPHGETPLALIRSVRDAAAAQIARGNEHLPAPVPQLAQLGASIGALICMPRSHAQTRVWLDVEDHRRQIKVLGLDELAALMAMVRTGVQLSATARQTIAEEIFAARQWHDGQRMLFEPAQSGFHLRLLQAPEHDLSLLGGNNLIGRRRSGMGLEYRLALSGDELMSNDHAVISCAEDGSIRIADTSTNGTWLTRSDVEQHIHRSEYLLHEGDILRMGITRMRLERDGEG